MLLYTSHPLLPPPTQVCKPVLYVCVSIAALQIISSYTNAYILNLERKMLLKNLFAGQQWRNRHREQTYGHRKRGGEGEINGKSNMKTYITTCKIDSQWEFAVWLRELKQGLCINLEGWVGKGNGREGTWVYQWLIFVDVWQKTTKFCKAIIPQLKINIF